MSSEARNRVEHELFLRSFMSVAPTLEVTQQLTGLMRDEYFERGQTIYARGAPAQRIYFIVVGGVELRREGTEPWRLEDESIVGILDASLTRPHTRTAVATRPTHAISLLFTDYLEVMEDNFEFALQTLKLGMIRGNEIAVELGNEAFAYLCDATRTAPFFEPGTEFDVSSRLLALHASPMFSTAPIQALATLAQHARVHHVSRGTVLCEAGASATQLLVLVDGQARIVSREHEIDAIVAPVRVLGGPAAFGYDTSFFDIRVERASVVLSVEREDLLDVMEDHFGLLRSFFALVATHRERLMHVKYAGSSVPPSIAMLRE